MDYKCGHCGMWHPGVTCPRIRVIEYHPDGTVKRVEYHAEPGKQLVGVRAAADADPPGHTLPGQIGPG